MLSPDFKRAFFKTAEDNGGDDYMSKDASPRQGCVCFDLETAQMKWFRAIGSAARYTKLKGVPDLRGMHLSVNPNGQLMVTDGIVEGRLTEWCVLVADMCGVKWQALQTFDQNKGTKSWHRNDPHPAFSADGKRIYYNISDDEFTRLTVAEIP